MFETFQMKVVESERKNKNRNGKSNQHCICNVNIHKYNEYYLNNTWYLYYDMNNLLHLQKPSFKARPTLPYRISVYL